jgi:phospholipid/cholesterol/gamma-HCH transport system substrate-binding protein
MENKSHAFWAGLFTIGLIFAVGLAVYWFTLDRSVRVPYDLIARTSVSGLSADADVRYRGLEVGKVQSVRFDQAHPGQIAIRILVDKRTPITHSTYGSLGLQGVTGIAYIQLDDTGRDLTRLSSSPEHVAQLPMHPGLLEQLQARGGVLLSEVESVAEHANNMLSDDTREQLMATAASLQRTADAVTKLVQQAGPSVAQLPGTLAELQRTLKSTNALVTNLNAQSGPLTTNLDRIGGAADRAGVAVTQMDAALQTLSTTLTYETLPRLYSLETEASGAARSVNRAANVLSTSPTSVLFGVARAAPGPGEPGFTWPSPGVATAGAAEAAAR